MPATRILGRVPCALTQVFMCGCGEWMGAPDTPSSTDAIVRDGFVAGNTLKVRTDRYHTNVAGDIPAAGHSYGDPGTSTSGTTTPWAEGINEVVMFCAINPGRSWDTASAVGLFSSLAGTEAVFNFDGGGNTSITISGYGVVASAAAAIPPDEWTWLGVHYYRNNTGFLRCYADSFANEFLSFSGETRGGGAGVRPIDQLYVYLNYGANQAGHAGASIDDIIVCGRTIYFDTLAAGVPAVGDTVTEGTTGATCKIGRVDIDPDTPTQGILWVERLVNSGGLGFVSGHNIGNGTWTAVAKNSIEAEGWWIVPQVLLYTFPDTTDGAATMTSSAGGGAKYTDVDKAVDDATYSIAAADLDTMAPITGTIETGFNVVTFVGVSAMATQSGAGPTQAQLGIDIAGTTEDSQPLPVNNTPTVLFHGLGQLSPDTGAAYTEAEINDAKQRFTARS